MEARAAQQLLSESRIVSVEAMIFSGPKDTFDLCPLPQRVAYTLLYIINVVLMER